MSKVADAACAAMEGDGVDSAGLIEHLSDLEREGDGKLRTYLDAAARAAGGAGVVALQVLRASTMCR